MEVKPPDLTRDFVLWLKENYPLTIWDGRPESIPDYHQRVGVVELTAYLEGLLTEEHEAEDAQSAL